MSKKSGKGKKVDLASFVGSEESTRKVAGVAVALPTAPKARDPNAEYDEKGYLVRPDRPGYGGGSNSGGGRGGYTIGSSSGEGDEKWGRRGMTVGNDANERPSSRFGSSNSSGAGAGASATEVSEADNASTWRRPTPPITTTTISAPIGEADTVDDWRKVERPDSSMSSSRVGAAVVKEADKVDDWRKEKVVLPDPKPPIVREADKVDDWRKVTTPVLPEIRGPSEPDKVSDWRKVATSTPPVTITSEAAAAPAETSNWRNNKDSTSNSLEAKAATNEEPSSSSSSSSRPKLKLQPRNANKTAATSSNESEGDVNTASSTTGEKKDKWDTLFNSRNEKSSTRRYGDKEQDLQREEAFKVFGKGNTKKPVPAEETPEERAMRENAARIFGGSSRRGGGGGGGGGGAEKDATSNNTTEDRSNAFAAFSTVRKPSTTNTTPTDSEDAERTKASFSKFGSKERSDRDAAYSVFNRDPKSNRGDDGQQARSEAFSMFSSNKPQRNNNETFEERNKARENAFAAFGGGRPKSRNEDESSSGNNFNNNSSSSSSSSSSNIRPNLFGSSRRGPSSENNNSTTSTATQGVLPKIDPKAKWMDDDEEDSQATKKSTTPAPASGESVVAPVSLTPEQLIMKTESILKEYFLNEGRQVAIDAFSALKSPSHMPVVVKRVIDHAISKKTASVKTSKVAAGLLEGLVKANVMTLKDVEQGFNLVCEKPPADKTELLNAYKVFVEKWSDMSSLQLNNETQTVLNLKSATSTPSLTAAATSAESSDMSIANQLLSSGKKGKLLFELAQSLNFTIALVPELVSLILSDSTKLSDISWVNKDEYGFLLAKLCFSSSPNSAKIKADVDVINAIQLAFHKGGFPKSSDGAYIEKTFNKLYELDIIPDEAFLAWKDDFKSTVEGRNTAIIQTSSFISFLETPEEDEEDEE